MDFDSVIAPALLVIVALLLFVFCIYRFRSLRLKSVKKWRRITERVLLPLVVLVAVAAAASASFNVLAARHYRRVYPPKGNLYLVDGYKMHLYCTGQGSPTILLDAGLGNDSLIWTHVQPELSKITRVCSYDRAGFGWSDLQPAPRDANRIADQWHALLTQAKVAGPVIPMGHSIAGMYIRAYAARYPQDVVGLVFVDGSTPLQDDRFPANAFGNVKLELMEARLQSILGLPRIIGQCSQESGFEATVGRELAQDECSPTLIRAIQREEDSFRQSSEETIHTGPFGDIPILIFSQDPQPPPAAGPQTPITAQIGKIWNQMQEELKLLSTHSRRIVAKGSTHYVQLDRYQMLNSEVTTLILQIRGQAPPPTTYRMTITE